MEINLISKGQKAETINNICFKILTICWVLILVRSSIIDLIKINEKYGKREIIFKDDADFKSKLENTSDYNEQHELMKARISQRAYEIKYGKKLTENTNNEFDNNPSNKFGAILGTIISPKLLLGFIGFFLIKLLFNPLKHNLEKYKKYINKEISINDYKKSKNLTLTCTVFITLLFIIPTFGLILLLTFFQLNFTVRT